MMSLLYLISPLDLIPDPIPGLGLIDDIGIVLLLITLMSDRLGKYERGRHKLNNQKKDNDEENKNIIDAEYEVIGEKNK